MNKINQNGAGTKGTQKRAQKAAGELGEPVRFIPIANYKLPVYLRRFIGRPNNNPAQVLVYKNAITGKDAQVSRVDPDKLDAEAALLVARGFVMPEQEPQKPALTFESAGRYEGLRTAAAAGGATPEELIAEALKIREILGSQRPIEAAQNWRQIHNATSKAKASPRELVDEALAVRGILGTESPIVAARFYDNAIRGGYKPTRIGVVVQKFIAENVLLRKGAEYIYQMRYLLPRCARYFRGRIFGDIKAREYKEFFQSLSLEPNSLRAYRGLIKTISNWSQMEGYLPQGSKPQIFFVSTSRYVPGAVEIIEPDELAGLLATVYDLNTILFLVFGAFGGLRTIEFKRLTWAKFKEEFIHLDRDVVKHGTKERYVPILPVLRAWLAPFLKAVKPGEKDKKICGPFNFNSYVKAAAKLLKIKVKRNWLRHGFGSYRAGASQNKEQTITEMGDSHFVFHRHYFSAQNKTAAEKYFALFPPPDWETRWREILEERRQAFKKSQDKAAAAMAQEAAI